MSKAPPWTMWPGRCLLSYPGLSFYISVSFRMFHELSAGVSAKRFDLDTAVPSRLHRGIQQFFSDPFAALVAADEGVVDHPDFAVFTGLVGELGHEVALQVVGEKAAGFFDKVHNSPLLVCFSKFNVPEERLECKYPACDGRMRQWNLAARWHSVRLN